jgi:hypothetical protein
MVPVAISLLAALLFAQAEPLGRIYVYAQVETPARSWLPISCDNAVVAKVKRGRFFAVDVVSGRHVLSMAKTVPVFVDVRPGEESFVGLGWQMEVGRPPLPVLQAVQPSHAHTEMIDLAYIDSNKALSKSVPRIDPRRPPQLKSRGSSR